MASNDVRDGSGSRLALSGFLISAAAVLSVGILILAIFLPVVTVLSAHAGVQPRESLVAADGWLVLLPAAVPLVVCGVVARLIRTSCVAAIVVSAALLLVALAGFAAFVVGIFVLPVGVLLVVASAFRLAETTHQAI